MIDKDGKVKRVLRWIFGGDAFINAPQAIKDALAVPDIPESLSSISTKASDNALTAADIAYVTKGIWSGDISPDLFKYLGDLDWWQDTYLKSLPKPESTSGFRVFKDVSGNPRWFGWTSNQWRDREGEILVDSAHREFVSWLDANPTEAPELWSWHTEGTARKHRADWWDYAHGFLMFSGPLTEEEAREYRNLEGLAVGMSHGFWVLKKVGRFILKYRTFEVSDLEVGSAANPFTAFDVLMERTMFSKPKRDYLATLLGEDKVAALEAETEAMERALEDLGIEKKEFDTNYIGWLEERAAEKAEAEVASATESLVEAVLKALNIEELQAVLGSLATDVKGLSGVREKLEALEADVAALKETDDRRISALFTPTTPVSWQSVTTSKATDEDEDVVEEEDLTDEEKEAVKQAKQVNWLAGMVPTSLG